MSCPPDGEWQRRPATRPTLSEVRPPNPRPETQDPKFDPPSQSQPTPKYPGNRGGSGTPTRRPCPERRAIAALVPTRPSGPAPNLRPETLDPSPPPCSSQRVSNVAVTLAKAHPARSQLTLEYPGNRGEVRAPVFRPSLLTAHKNRLSLIGFITFYSIPTTNQPYPTMP